MTRSANDPAGDATLSSDDRRGEARGWTRGDTRRARWCSDAVVGNGRASRVCGRDARATNGAASNRSKRDKCCVVSDFGSRWLLIRASRQRAANPTKEKRLTATLDSPRHTRSRRMLASRLASLVRVSSAFRVHRRHTVDPARATRARTRVRSRGSRRPGRAEASFSLCRVPSSSETVSGPLPA